MRKYESIVVFSPEQGDAQVKQEIKRFEGILQSKGAKNLTVDTWGKQDLAYVVRKKKQGRFTCFKYETEDYGAVEALTSLLRISDSVIKFQSHKINEKVRKFRGNPKRAARPDAFDDDFADSIDIDY